MIISPCGGADEEIIPISGALLTKEFIRLTDTSQFVHYIENGSFVVDSVRITNVEMNLESNGRFTLVKE